MKAFLKETVQIFVLSRKTVQSIILSPILQIYKTRIYITNIF
ncbi:hypothetical protein B0I21_101123 [Sphingobacterium paludis]|uniref:Uncharacterized protein n=1 Tax=Sphingobacterium paludis TaxID=1476465 RepID=A0A4R7DAI6_9SPHI|nr:hypothetical protein B0I21_101123 [Sphingobacterium paludis]